MLTNNDQKIRRESPFQHQWGPVSSLNRKVIRTNAHAVQVGAVSSAINRKILDNLQGQQNQPTSR